VVTPWAFGHFLLRSQGIFALPVGKDSTQRSVQFSGAGSLLDTVAHTGFEVFDVGGNMSKGSTKRLPLLVMSMEQVTRAVREVFGNRIARERFPAIREQAARWKADLLVCDEMDFGSMLAAEHLSLPYATMLVIASGLLAKKEWLDEPLTRQREEYGLSPDPGLVMLSRYLVLSPFPPGFRDPRSPLPATAHSFRPSASNIGDAPAWLDHFSPKPTVYVTLGTDFNIGSGDLFERILEGLQTLPIDVIATVGRDIDPAEFGPQPENVRIERYIDQWFVLPRCDLMVCHAGSGSVSAALAHGLPMLLLPLGADQQFNAQRSRELGIALTLDPLEATPRMVQNAAATLLAGEDFRHVAQRFRDEIAALPGEETVVSLLCDIAQSKTPPRR